MRNTPEYPQKDLLAAAPEGMKDTIASTPDRFKKIPVPRQVIDAVRGNEFETGPEEALCGLEEESGLSALRFSTRQLADRALCSVGDEEDQQ